MRALFASSILLAGWLVPTVFAEPATIEFDRTRIQSGESELSVVYADFQPVAMGGTYLLSSMTAYVELFVGESAAQIHYSTVNAPQSLGMRVEPMALADAPTSEESRYNSLISSACLEQTGRQAVGVMGETRVGLRRFAALALFPVVLDTSGRMMFNPGVDVFVGNRKIARQEMLSEPAFANLSRSEKSLRTSDGAGAGAEYLIVTGRQLVEALEKLRRYKTSTGYVTEVKTIDEILNQSQGRDDAERLREYLKSFYADGGRYVLLAGDETILPIRYTYQYDVDQLPQTADLSLTDLYFADLSADWDPDSDGVFGERLVNLSGLAPELRVGRLPFNTAEEVSNYIDKLIAWETNPGNGDPSYLNKAFFFSADQMRDYPGGGQHFRIAQAYPSDFVIDTVDGVEAASGADETPTSAAACDLEQTLSNGFGIVNILAHGRSDGFAVRTTGYNNWPKSNFLTEVEPSPHGSFTRLAANGKTAFYYSLACDNGGFDLDQPPMNLTRHNLAQTLLSLNGAGAVGFVAYSRSGWVSSSHLLQKTFFDSLFAHPDLPAVDAMYKSQAANYYYRDLVYGQNFFGDPTLRVYNGAPGRLSVTLEQDLDRLGVMVTAGGEAVGGCTVILSDSSAIVGRYVTNSDGLASITDQLGLGTTYTVSAVRTGFTVGQKDYTPGLAAGVDEPTGRLPKVFLLAQNYPNPFNPITRISFDLPVRAHVTLTVFNVLGQAVETLLDAELPAGSHTVEWTAHSNSGSQPASGVYFYRLDASAFTAVKKMILLK